ncbi:MAG: S66 peptidase family protein [Desulfomonilaceae bacterium]
MSKNSKIHKSLLIPAPLKNGDLVGVIAASGPVTSDLLDGGIRFLEATGFRVKTGNYLYEKNGYLAGTDNQRCEDLNAMLSDPEVRGIFFARGGYGAMRLLDRLDGNSIVRDPIIVLGMSDVTALQLSMLQRFNLVTFSGPMVAGQIGAGLDEMSKESFVQSLTEPLNNRNLWPANSSIRVLQEGSARGKLVGGCLSLVVALLGTPHIPDLRDSILFIEDVNEAAYRIDRMLTQLKLAGALRKVKALALGHFLGPEGEGEDLGPEVDRIVMELMTDKRIPIISGFPHGHVLPNLTIPHGAPVMLNTDRAQLKV